MLKKFPPEIPGADELSLPTGPGHHAEDLLPLQGAFDQDLGIAHGVDSLGADPADPVHDKPAVGALIKHRIPHPQGPVRRAEKDRIPVADEEGGHGIAGNQQAHFLALPGQLPQDGQILPGIHSLHGFAPFCQTFYHKYTRNSPKVNFFRPLQRPGGYGII